MSVRSNGWSNEWLMIELSSLYGDEGSFFLPFRQKAQEGYRRKQHEEHGRDPLARPRRSGRKDRLPAAAFASGKYVQGFPEYGPERMGAPITAYNRISDERCTIHSNIYNPDYVVVVDETLLQSVDVTHGLNPEGAIVINTHKSPDEVRPLLRGYEGRVYTLDARAISERTLGKYFPNTPMLAAIVKVSGVLDPWRFVSDMEISFKHKFATKPQVIAGNMECLTQSLKEVRG